MSPTEQVSPTGRQRRPRRTKPMTPERLERIALHYLERYATSSGHLRRVLDRRIRRAAREHEIDEQEAARWVAALIARLERVGFLDDRAYACARAAGLSARGYSGRYIRRALQARDVASEDVEAALREIATLDEDPELCAATRYARRLSLIHI